VAGNSTEPGQSVTSRVSAILLTFTDCDERSLTDIARLAGLPVSTAHRLAVELASRNLLERDEDGHYRVGLPLRGIGTSEWRAPTLVERASCVLDDLSGALHRPARLGVLSGSEVKYVEKRPHYPVTSFDVAATLPAHATALGKVLLAFSPTRITDGLLAKGLTQFTRYTIVAPEKFRHNLSTIRQTRVAVSSGELEVGNHCVAMPVFADGKVLAAIEVQVQDPQNDLARVSPALEMACGGLSRELSGAPKGRRPVDQVGPSHPVPQGGVNGTHSLDPIDMRATRRNTAQPRSAASL
jgi:IclR family transcriptional regulator, acetate operon repressor